MIHVDADVAAPRDLLGRKVPHRLNFMHFARAIPGYIDQFKAKVPHEFYAQVDVDTVDVACPCGADPPPRCVLLVPTACVCGRVFAYTGHDVRVAYIEDSAS